MVSTSKTDTTVAPMQVAPTPTPAPVLTPRMSPPSTTLKIVIPTPTPTMTQTPLIPRVISMIRPTSPTAQATPTSSNKEEKEEKMISIPMVVKKQASSAQGMMPLPMRSVSASHGQVIMMRPNDTQRQQISQKEAAERKEALRKSIITTIVKSCVDTLQQIFKKEMEFVEDAKKAGKMPSDVMNYSITVSNKRGEEEKFILRLRPKAIQQRIEEFSPGKTTTETLTLAQKKCHSQAHAEAAEKVRFQEPDLAVKLGCVEDNTKIASDPRNSKILDSIVLKIVRSTPPRLIQMFAD